ncbi:MAG: hypothetical protein U5K77_03155 [Candidatus Saccharibacteria bacterium]|nr:hypothetical protein [Candidatus Saccharibacteria bacterium]
MKVFGKLLTVISVASLGFISLAPAVLAQQQGGSGLSVSPTRTELRIEPGSSSTFTINVRNVTTNSITARPVVNDFYSDDETGQPQIVVNEEIDVPSIRPFMPELDEITLAEGEDQSVEIVVSVPEDTAPGGYYGVVRYLAVPEGAPSQDDGQVSLTASVSSILLVEVPGEIREQVQLRNIEFYRQDIAGTFFTSPPEQVGLHIVNQGNGFEKPFGNVSVSNMFGNEVHNYEINTGNPRSNVLPESSRTFKNDIEGVSMPGRYIATASVSFGNGGEVLILSDSFWYLPAWFVIGVLVLIILIGTGVYYARKRVTTGSFKTKSSSSKK